MYSYVTFLNYIRNLLSFYYFFSNYKVLYALLTSQLSFLYSKEMEEEFLSLLPWKLFVPSDVFFSC